jgi:hypothetical protein
MAATTAAPVDSVDASRATAATAFLTADLAPVRMGWFWMRRRADARIAFFADLVLANHNLRSVAPVCPRRAAHV